MRSIFTYIKNDFLLRSPFADFYLMLARHILEASNISVFDLVVFVWKRNSTYTGCPNKFWISNFFLQKIFFKALQNWEKKSSN